MAEFLRKTVIATSVATLLCTVAPAKAQTQTRERPGFAMVRDACTVAVRPVSIDGSPPAGDREGLFAGVAAGFVAELAGEAISGIAGAIRRASEERAFNLTGTSSFDYYRISQSGGEAAVIEPASKCLILYIPSMQSGGMTADDSVSDMLGAASPITLATLTPGVTDRLPAVYVEALLRQTPDGVRIQPVLLWYREALRGAPNGPAEAELQVALATPASNDDSEIGDTFAFVRIPLSQISPGTLLRDVALQPRTSVTLPHRPRDGSPDRRMNAMRGLEAAVVTRQAEVRGASHVLREAQRQRRSAANADTAEAEALATIALDDARELLTEAQAERDSAWMQYRTPKSVGATNLEFNLVVIRDANQFGLAIAAALGEQREEVETAVGEALTRADWRPSDTAKLQSMIAVAAKRRELDAAIASGDAVAIQRLRDELLIEQANANQAAVAAGVSIPYPNLSVPD